MQIIRRNTYFVLPVVSRLQLGVFLILYSCAKHRCCFYFSFNFFEFLVLDVHVSCLLIDTVLILCHWMSGPVTTYLADHSQAGTPSRFVTSHLGQLSLAIPLCNEY